MLNTILEFNVGGEQFDTLLSTIKTKEQNYLMEITSDESVKEGRCLIDEDGCVFIDRDPHMFKYILKYLRKRNTDFVTLLSKEIKQELLEESIFYKMNELTIRLQTYTKPILSDAQILTFREGFKYVIRFVASIFDFKTLYGIDVLTVLENEKFDKLFDKVLKDNLYLIENKHESSCMELIKFLGEQFTKNYFSYRFNPSPTGNDISPQREYQQPPIPDIPSLVPTSPLTPIIRRPELKRETTHNPTSPQFVRSEGVQRSNSEDLARMLNELKRETTSNILPTNPHFECQQPFNPNNLMRMLDDLPELKLPPIPIRRRSIDMETTLNFDKEFNNALRRLKEDNSDTGEISLSDNYDSDEETES